jgi:hypothetical protein
MSESTDTWSYNSEAKPSDAGQEAKPTVTILAVLKGGVLIRTEWTPQNIVQISDKTLQGMQALGINVINDPTNYLFKEGML